MSNYPRTVDEVIKDKKYKPEALRALEAFKKQKPWAGTVEERQAKFEDLHRVLNSVYGKETKLRFVDKPIHGYFRPATQTITLGSQLSVVTYLHEYGHSLYGSSEIGAVEWSVNLFRRVFPKSYAKLHHEGYMLRKKV